ncbi:hypothetical protein TTHERM_00290760 (macronuclear) [Tetrahymena thermophila SB210]|uniref:Uncharacterized protein n=1 Tax=Tetrahymena thermophila (strain SB210) TaxID=312017 RepID=I7M8M3_TETTS|nr:hypothetical protein TTHERM_00290760 [Tetrahymena thermophila SB210]EAR98448.1 hypothetical protein TTHERM_00290760 [Tetrahymena thermophila SB210]|eukprot:XP_001018693.1 hypothetical protein TTHERM_00290760 [Tetrahymena thermophila SB210]
MKNQKQPPIRKSAINTPSNQSVYASRKNTQMINQAVTKEEIVSPQKQSQFFQAQQAEKNQQSEQLQKANTHSSSRIEYIQNTNSSLNNFGPQNDRTPEHQNSISNLEDYNQQINSQYYNPQQNNTSDQQGKKVLKTIRSEAKMFEVAQGNVQNIDFNYTIVDNLIAKRGFAQEKMVPMELFQETMQYFERRLTGIEQRIEDNEQLIHLSDRLLELRSFNPNSSISSSSGVKDRYSQQISYYQGSQMSPTGFSGLNSNQGMNNGLNRAGTGDFMTSTFGSAQTQKNSGYPGVGNSAPPKQTESRYEGTDLNNQQIMNNTTIMMDLNTKVALIEKKLTQFEDFNKSILTDIDKKFADYSKKFNTQIDKFFKNAAQKFESYGEKEQKINIFQETIQQKIDLMNQTFSLKQEELVVNKEELNDNIKTLSALISKLENRINEHSIDIEENKTLIKGIEDDLFIMLQNYKDLSEGVQKYRNFSDEISYLKQNMTNILKNTNISPIHLFKN